MCPVTQLLRAVTNTFEVGLEYISAAKPPVKPHNTQQHNSSPEELQGNDEESCPALAQGRKAQLLPNALSHREQGGMALLDPTPFQASQ